MKAHSLFFGAVAVGVAAAFGCGTSSEPENHGDGDGDGDAAGDGDVLGDGDGGEPGDGDSSGGMPGDGDGDGSGGANPGGTGGQGMGGENLGGAGSGGTESVANGAVVPFGAPCGTPGSLACSDLEMKLTLICGTSGTWEANETCPGDQMCDPSEPNRGSCQSPFEPCQERMEGDVYCEGTKNYECNERLLSATEVSDCSIGCLDGVCTPVDDACPAEDGEVYSCATDCGDFSCLRDSEGCPVFVSGVSSTSPAYQRIPEAAALCETSASGCELGAPTAFFMGLGLEQHARVHLPEDWDAAVAQYDDLGEYEENCSLPRHSGCLELDGTSGGPVVLFFPNRPDAAARNIDIEYADEPLPCP